MPVHAGIDGWLRGAPCSGCGDLGKELAKTHATVQRTETTGACVDLRIRHEALLEDTNSTASSAINVPRRKTSMRVPCLMPACVPAPTNAEVPERYVTVVHTMRDESAAAPCAIASRGASVATARTRASLKRA